MQDLCKKKFFSGAFWRCYCQENAVIRKELLKGTKGTSSFQEKRSTMPFLRLIKNIHFLQERIILQKSEQKNIA